MILGLKQSFIPLLPFGRRDEGDGWLGRVRIWELDHCLEDGGKGLVDGFCRPCTLAWVISREMYHIFTSIRIIFLTGFPFLKLGILMTTLHGFLGEE